MELMMPLAVAPSAATPFGGRSLLSRWLSDCHGIWYNAALVVPSALFVAYLATQARRSVSKLNYGRSHIIILAYYVLLWALAILNLAWCFLQAWQCTPTKELSWNLLSLFTNTGLLFMEVSLIAFLLQGNNAGGLESLNHTFVVSGALVAVDVLLKVIYLFGFGIPLFIDDEHSGSSWKWLVLFVHKLLLTLVYALILYMHHSKWRERLPAKPAYYNYLCAMLLLNAISLIGCFLITYGATFGFWLHNLAAVCYHSFYLPLLYVTFLADFFQEDDMRLENIYYSEMKDAGFFDNDWE